VARKDTAATVLGMLSSTGASTRPSSPADSDGPSEKRDGELPAVADEAPAAAPSSLPAPVAVPSLPAVEDAPAAARVARRRTSGPAPAPESAGREVPRTLRLRASTAAALRDAWLEAKRDDVLLSHQDFASDLLDSVLRRRGPRR
jgi:hypothetical protein